MKYPAKPSDEEFELIKNDLIKDLNDFKPNLNNTEERKQKSNSFNYQEQDLFNEEWKPYPGNEYNRYHLFYEVSSLGRVKCEGEIIHQKDQDDCIGYLILDADKHKDKKIYAGKLVYVMVAETFLGKKENDFRDIHHITNNSYDNSINNLILLTRTQHDKIHGKI